MTYAGRLLVFAGVSALGHAALVGGVARLPARERPARPAAVRVELREPPPPPLRCFSRPAG